MIAVVVLDLSHDLLLDAQGREGQFEVFNIIARNALHPASARHLCDSGIPKEWVHDTERSALVQRVSIDYSLVSGIPQSRLSSLSFVTT